MRAATAVLALVGALLMVRGAWAQVWLTDRASSAGPGFKLGDSLVLHLGLGAEGGYDTNSLFSGEDPHGAGRLRIAPFVDLATRPPERRTEDEGAADPTPPKAEFRAGVAGYWDQYFSSEERIQDASDFGVDTHLNLVVLPERNFTLFAEVGYMRTLQPYETSTDARARQHLTPGVAFQLRPGGGTLSLEAGYKLRFLFFEDDDLGVQNNQHAHDVHFEIRWKTFPKTALVSRTLFSPTFYYEGGSINQNSLPIRTWLGLVGLLTNRFGLQLLGGYGASNYDSGPNFDSFLARGELMFFVTPMAQLRLGGERDFVDSFYGNYFVKTGGYLKYSQIFGGIILATLKGEAYYRDYATFNGPLPSGATPSTPDRDDVWTGVSLLVEWRALEWLTFHVSGEYLADFTEFYYHVPVVDPETGDGYLDRVYSTFQRFVVFGGVRAHY